MSKKRKHTLTAQQKKHSLSETENVQILPQETIPEENQTQEQEVMPEPEPVLPDLEHIIEQNPFAQLLGIQLLELREGYAYGRMRFDEHFTNIYGGMHGGCTYALADTLAGIAASTYGNYVTTIDGKMNYLDVIRDTSYVYCEAKVQRQGGRIGVYTAVVMDDQQNILVTADFTYYRTGKVIENN